MLRKVAETGRKNSVLMACLKSAVVPNYVQKCKHVDDKKSNGW